jgi:hypothetical protein
MCFEKKTIKNPGIHAGVETVLKTAIRIMEKSLAARDQYC